MLKALVLSTIQVDVIAYSWIQPLEIGYSDFVGDLVNHDGVWM
jgi:hypothetical protein